MPLRPRILSLWRNVCHGKQVDQDLDEEIRAQLDMLIEEKASSGMSWAEARRAALLEFGGVEQVKEQVRASRIGFLLETLWKDLRFGFRMLVRNPGFTSAAVVSLALGIGATTAVFSILDTIFLRPLPYPEPDRLVGITENQLGKPEAEGWMMVSTPTFLDWKQQSQRFDMLTQSRGTIPSVLNRSDRADMILTRAVSDGYFAMLGAKVCQGRLLLPDDYKPGQVERGVLSHGAWQRLFGSDPSIVGNTIMVDGKPHQVVGVMCPEYRDLRGYKIDLWLGVNTVGNRQMRMWEVIGRLKPGTPLAKAQAEMDVIETRLAQQYPKEQKDVGARVKPLQVYLYGDQKMRFVAFFGAVVLVLSIACTNVANLFLARAVKREKEMAVRASLGAARMRLLRQLLTESLLLSFLGAALGLLLAYGGVQLAVYLSPEYVIPRAAEISVDVRILGFVVTVTCLTALLFGLFPALTASKPDLNESLKEGGCRAGDRPGARRVQGALVVAQIALSLVLLIGAGLMMHNTWRVLYANVGFNTEHMMQVYIRLSRDYLESVGEGSPYVRMRPKATLTIQEITSRLKALPGVVAVSVTTSGVLNGCNSRPVGAEAALPQQDYEQAVCYDSVGPSYFRMLGIPLLKGRDFMEEDSRNSTPVAVISQSAAQRYFPGQNPVGKMINIGIWDTDEFERRQVVGVVGDVQWGVFHPDRAAVYYPYSQLPARFSAKFAGEYLRPTFLVRSASDPANLAHAMEQAAREVAKDVVMPGTWTADYTRRLNSQGPRFYTWLMATFAGTALVLAAVGIFGVMSYAVTRRTHEIGIRLALGAHPGDVQRLILYAGIRLTLTGTAIGLGSALGLARFLRSWFSAMQFNEVKPTDPATLAVVSLFLALVALLACYIPARRAARMNPLTSLRYE